MAAREAKNPERRTDLALLALCIGLGLIGLGWVLGVGGAFAFLASGNFTAAGGALAAQISAALATVIGFLMALVATGWLVVQVILDQTRKGGERNYSRDVER